jgi:nitrile hydratase accessory protein
MNRDILDTVDPPRKNGELVFDAPWEGRSFGLALALHEQGLFDWEEFRRRLISSIAADPAGDYYEQWLRALETLLTDLRILTREEITARVEEFACSKREVTY